MLVRTTVVSGTPACMSEAIPTVMAEVMSVPATDLGADNMADQARRKQIAALVRLVLVLQNEEDDRQKRRRPLQRHSCSKKGNVVGGCVHGSELQLKLQKVSIKIKDNLKETQ